MIRYVVAIALPLAAAGALAQSRAGGPERIEIDMSSFKFTPSTITLKHGQPYILHSENTSDGGHDFVAKRFFEAAQVAGNDRALIAKGEFELRGGAPADVHLVAPAAGRYEAHCSHFMHSTFGMKAGIVVD